MGMLDQYADGGKYRFDKPRPGKTESWAEMHIKEMPISID